MLRQEYARRIRQILSGAPTGVPEWTPLVEAGDDEGLFAPSDAPWIVHADIATMIGGVRALLLQALHPGALAGVAQHSRYEEDALGRLSGTIRWLTICTFASRSAVADEAARVRAMHERVRGSYARNDGQQTEYRASDVDLLEWVHLAFTDSFLAANQVYGKRQVDANEYVGKWGQAVKPLGMHNPPADYAALQQRLRDFAPHLRVDDRTQRVVAFIRKPPLPGAARIVYRVLFAAAVDTLPGEMREQLGLRVVPGRIARPMARITLSAMRWVLGSVSPLEQAAQQRLARLQGQVSA